MALDDIVVYLGTTCETFSGGKHVGHAAMLPIQFMHCEKRTLV